MAISGNKSIQSAAGRFYDDYKMPGSLKIDDNDQSYLYWTPERSGNRMQFTFSCWVKWGAPSSVEPALFSSRNGGDTDVALIRFNDYDLSFSRQIEVFFRDAGGVVRGLYITDGSFNANTDSWVHICVSVDTRAKMEAHRCRVYINGVAQPLEVSVPLASGQTLDFGLSGSSHQIGRQGSFADYFDGYISDVYFFDSVAVGPDVFGEYDKFKQWQPKSPDYTDPAFYDLTGTTGSAYKVSNIGTAPGKFGNALSFDGDGLYQSKPGSLDLGADDFTIDMWVYWEALGGYFDSTTPQSSSQNYQRFFSIGNGATEGVYMETQATDVDGGYGFSIGFRNEGATGLVGPGQYGERAQANRWYHIALVRDSVGVRSYLDGRLVYENESSDAQLGVNFDSSCSVVLGAWENSINPSTYARHLKGMMDDVRIVKGRALYTGASFDVPTTRSGQTHDTVFYVSGDTIRKSDDVYSYENSGYVFNGDNWLRSDPLTSPIAGVNSDRFKDLSDVSISVWFKTTTSGITQSIVAYGEHNGGDKASFIMQVLTDNAIQVWYEASDDADYYTRSTTVAQRNTWYHVTWTFDRSSNTAKIYVNGVLEQTVSHAQSPAIIDHFLTVGSRTNNGSVVQDYFQGNIKDVAIYDTVIDGNAVEDLYNSGKGIPASEVQAQSLLVYYPLNGNNGDAALNASGNSETLRFITNSRVEFDADLEAFQFGQNDFSYGIWVKTDDDSAYPTIIRGGQGAGSTDPRWGLSISTTDAPYLFYTHFRDDGGNGANGLIGGPQANDDEWHFVAITFEHGGNAKLYVDGTHVNTLDVSNLTGSMSTNTDSGSYGVALGYEWSNNYDFIGEMRDFFTYKTLLTDADIVALYNNGSGVNVAEYKPESLSGYWPLNQRRSDKIIDVSASEPSFYFQQSNDSSAVLFSQTEVNDFVNTTHGSISVWFKIMNASAGGRFIFQYFSNNADRLYLDSSGTFAFGDRGDFCGVNFHANQDTWYHFLGTWDSNGDVRCYVNGTRTDDGTLSFGNVGFTFQDSLEFFYLGRGWRNNISAFDGRIKEFALFGDVLDADDAVQIYNSGVVRDLRSLSGLTHQPTTYFRMNETDYGSITDVMGGLRAPIDALPGNSGSKGTGGGIAQPVWVENQSLYAMSEKAGSSPYGVNGFNLRFDSDEKDTQGVKFYNPSSGSRYIISPNVDLPPGSWSVQMWIYRRSNGRGGVFFRTDGPPYTGISFGQGGDDNFGINGNVSLANTTTLAALNRSPFGTSASPEEYKWIHSVGVWDDYRKVISLYMNGVLVEQKYDSTNLLSGSDFHSELWDMYIGSRSQNDQLDGFMKEVALWKTALSSDDVTKLWNDGQTYNAREVSGGNLIGYWKMNENSGDIIADSSRWSAYSGIKFANNNTTSYPIQYAYAGNLQMDRPTSGAIAFWMKPENVSNYQNPFHTDLEPLQGNGHNRGIRLELVDSGAMIFIIGDSGGTGYSTHTVAAGDAIQSGEWGHVVLKWTTSSVRVYINGVEKVNNGISSWTPNGEIFTNWTFGVGFRFSGSGDPRMFEGQLKDFAFYDTDLSLTNIESLAAGGDPSSINPSNVVFHLPFDDGPEEAGVGKLKKKSGYAPFEYAQNHGGIFCGEDPHNGTGSTPKPEWTGSNSVALMVNDNFGNTGFQGTNFPGNGSEHLSKDTPDNNFAVINPLAGSTVGVFSNGNLKVNGESSTSNIMEYRSSIGVSSGKWYCEAYVNSLGSGTNYFHLSVSSRRFLYRDNSNQNGSSVGDVTLVYPNSPGTSTSGTILKISSSGTSTNAATVADTGLIANGDVLGISLDADNDTVQFYKNGYPYGPSIQADNVNDLGKYWIAPHSRIDSVVTLNFGQDSSFGGVRPRNGFTDAKGKGDFQFQPPDGHLAICASNLPEPDFIPHEGFDNVTWTGSGEANRRVNGLDFKPDLVWLRPRNFVDQIIAFDKERTYVDGSYTGHNFLYLAANSAQGTQNGGIRTMNDDGFTFGTNFWNNVNDRFDDYIAHCWKEGPEYGLDIRTYEGTGTAQNISHDLGKSPKFILVKNIDNSPTDWHCYHASLGNTTRVIWNTVSTQVTGTSAWNYSTPGSTAVALGGNNDVNASGATYIMYAWSAIPGFSDFGTYSANGSLEGPYIDLGFKPAMLIIRRVDQSRYGMIFNNKSNVRNPAEYLQFTNDLSPEQLGHRQDLSHTERVHFTATGFYIETDNSNYINQAGGTYIYAAWAEAPTKYATGK